jgi:hypothetical protein
MTCLKIFNRKCVLNALSVHSRRCHEFRDVNSDRCVSSKGRNHLGFAWQDTYLCIRTPYFGVSLQLMIAKLAVDQKGHRETFLRGRYPT